MTTSCEFVKFNKLGNKLVFSSKWKKNAIKVASLKNMKVLSDFPPNKSIKYPFCSDFNLSDDYLAVGNDEGRVLLYKNVD